MGGNPRTVVLVHGLWVTHRSWDAVRCRWEGAGWTVHTPEWPVLQGRDPTELNASPPLALGNLGLGAIVDRHEAFIRSLAVSPVILGHSFGGLFTQMLLDRGLGSAGMAINPAPIAGAIPGWLTLTAALPAMARWRGWRKPYALTRRRWAARFANGAPRAVSEAAYDDYVIPAPGRLIHEAALQLGTGIDPRRRSAPLLITGSDADRLVTRDLSLAAWRIQSRSAARTDYLDFPGHSHLLLAEPGWERVVDTLIAWAEAAIARPVRSHVP